MQLLVGESGHERQARLPHIPITGQIGLERVVGLVLMSRPYSELVIGNMPLNFFVPQFTHLKQRKHSNSLSWYLLKNELFRQTISSYLLIHDQQSMFL